MIEPVKNSIEANHARSDGHYMPLCHSHLHYEFNLVVSHDKLHIVNNESYIEIEAPCLIVHKPFTLHCLNAESGALYERYLLFFDQNALASLPKSMYDTTMLDASDVCVVPLRNIGEGGAEEELRCCIERIFFCRSERTRSILLCEALDSADRVIRASTPIRSGNSENYINDIIKYIYNNLSTDITTESLAERFFVSRAKLNRDFMQLTSTTVKKYTTTMRITCAKRMLSEGAAIRDTALRCGFNHESHFITVFRRHSGMTPGQFARRGEDTSSGDELL